MARLEVLERFLQEIGTEAGGLSLEAIMEVSPGLHVCSSHLTFSPPPTMGVCLQVTNVCLVHVNKMVRDIAVRITLDLYKQVCCLDDWRDRGYIWRGPVLLMGGQGRMGGVYCAPPPAVWGGAQKNASVKS